MTTVITQEASAVWSGGALARLNQQTSALLKEFEQTPGVRHAFVFDNRGKLLGGYLNEELDRGDINRAGLCVAQILAALETRGGKPKEIELRFDRARLSGRDLGNAFVVVVCAPSINGSLLKMAMNVAAAPFESNADLQNRLRGATGALKDALQPANLDDAAWQLALKANLRV